MTALAGIWHFGGKPDLAPECGRMLASQNIYGPHGSKQWSASAIALGRNLFRTLPEDVFDRQPLRSADDRLVLVADVRLDNRSELVGQLNAPAERFRQACDAAVLLACLEQWGEAAVHRLVGDFAFALWNAPARKLMLARDFLGQRPLHYHRGKDFFAFASMPKGLHALADIPYGPDEQAMTEFIVLMPHSGPRSFFKHINRVEAGQMVTITPDGMTTRSYWSPRRPARGRAASDYVEGLRHHLDVATTARLRGAKGAVAAQLSGGFDSAAVTATAARLLAAQGGRITAFTAVPREGYDLPAPANRFGDEGPLAAAVAGMYPNIERVLIRAAHRSPLENLDQMFFLFDRPMLNLCNAVWVCAINRAARERGLNILLNGQMGNMSISYSGLERLPEMLRAGQFLRLWHEAGRLVANRAMSRAGVAAQTFGGFVPAALWRWANETFAGRRTDVLNYTAIRPERLAALDLEQIARERDLDFSYRPRRDGFAARIWVMRRVDMGNYNKGSLAGWQLDHRDPTADKRLVEYCLAIPTEHYLADGVPRALGRRALADRLPPALLRERRKGYQGIDWHEGLTAARNEVGAELERFAACGPAAQAIDVARLKTLLENWPTSGWNNQETIERYRLAMLRGIAAGHFLRKAMGAN